MSFSLSYKKWINNDVIDREKKRAHKYIRIKKKSIFQYEIFYAEKPKQFE